MTTMILALCVCAIVALICLAYSTGYRDGQKAERQRHLRSIRPYR